MIGLLILNDVRISEIPHASTVADYLIPIHELITAKEGISLTEANDLIWNKKISCLPILDNQGHLSSLVFRKDFEQHIQNPEELVDAKKSLMVGAAINSRDYHERVPALIEAGADVFCIDSSDGFSEWQAETVAWIKQKYGDSVKIGAGNIVAADAFHYLVAAGADFIKVGIGGGSICITREQKGIGLGQASALIHVARARDDFYAKTGEYVPICSDAGIVMDYHLTIALALGADFVMMGRYFARFDESPTRKLRQGNVFLKEYWAEGSNRARNWQRYDMGGSSNLEFEEGVDSYVPYAGKLKSNVALLIAKIKSTFCNCGVLTIADFHENAQLAIISQSSFREGGSHDVILKDSNIDILKANDF